MVKSLYCLYFILEIWSYGIRILISFTHEKGRGTARCFVLFLTLPSFYAKNNRKSMTEKVTLFSKSLMPRNFSNLKVCFWKYFMNL